MSTAISSLSSSTSTSATSFDPSKGAARFASKIFKDMDTDTDGSVTKDEFVKGLESKGVSATTPPNSSTPSTSKAPARSPKTTWNRPSRAATSNHHVHKAVKAASQQKARRRQRAGGAGGAGGASAAGGSSSATKTYEAADKNEDGTVTQQEQLVYDIAQASKSAAASSTSQIGTNIDALA